MYTLLPFLLIIVVFWFFLIRPQMRRQREAQSMRSSLVVGSEVMLTSGIYGTVSEVADTHVLVKIADGVTIKVANAAIGQVLPTGLEEPASPEESAEPEENE